MEGLQICWENKHFTESICIIKDDSDFQAFKETTWSYSKFVHHSAFLCRLSQPIQICCVFNKKFKRTFCSLLWKCLAQNKNVPSGTINSDSKDGLSSKRTNMMHTITWSIFLDLYICNSKPSNIKEKHYLNKFWCNELKFIYSEKATKFCEIFPLLLAGTTYDKKRWRFSEYMNFNIYVDFILFMCS